MRDDVVAQLRGEVRRLVLAPGPGSDEAEALAQLDALMTWLDPSLDTLSDTVAALNATYQLQLLANGIDLDQDDLDSHVLAAVVVLLAKLVRHGVILLPSC